MSRIRPRPRPSPQPRIPPPAPRAKEPREPDPIAGRTLGREERRRLPNPAQAASPRDRTRASRPGPALSRRSSPHDGSPMSSIQQVGDKVLANVERVIVGKHQEVRLALVALMCRGHLLIEDVPGTGKTVLATAIARSLGGTFRRLQVTPDFPPSDLP